MDLYVKLILKVLFIRLAYATELESRVLAECYEKIGKRCVLSDYRYYNIVNTLKWLPSTYKVC